MSFTGNENHDIPLSTASQWTKNYREANPTGATIAHFFGRNGTFLINIVFFPTIKFLSLFNLSFSL